MTDGRVQGEAAAQGVSRAELQRRAVSGFFWTAVHTLVAAPVAFIVNAVVARVLGPAEYGGLALLTLALMFVTHVSNLGVSDATVQWGAAAAVRGDRHEVGALLAKSLGFHVAVQMPLLIATVLVLARGEGFVAAVLVLGVSLPAILGSAALLIAIENRTAAGAKLAMLSNLLVQAGVLGAALVTDDAAWVWAVRTVASSLLLPLNFLLLDRWGRRAARRLELPMGLPPGYWRYAVPRMAAVLLSMLVFSRSEILVLTWLGDAVAVGLFALAFGVAVQVTAPVDALMGPLAPAAAGLVSAHPESVRSARDRSMRASSFLSGGLLAVVMPVLVSAMPLLYGQAYLAAQVPLFVLAAAACLKSSCNPLVAFFNARRQAGLVLRMTAVALVIDVILAVGLIPSLGIAGALLANVGGQMAFLMQLIPIEARQESESVRGVMISMRAWLIGLFSGCAAVAVPATFSDSAAGSALASFAIGLPLFVLGIRVTRSSLENSDWVAMNAALPPALRPPLRIAQAILRGSTQ